MHDYACVCMSIHNELGGEGTCAKGGKGGVHTTVITRKLYRFAVRFLS